LLNLPKRCHTKLQGSAAPYVSFIFSTALLHIVQCHAAHTHHLHSLPLSPSLLHTILTIPSTFLSCTYHHSLHSILLCILLSYTSHYFSVHTNSPYTLHIVHTFITQHTPHCISTYCSLSYRPHSSPVHTAHCHTLLTPLLYI
ncbi:unnamed protein product, partial [Staurois parvus]